MSVWKGLKRDVDVVAAERVLIVLLWAMLLGGLLFWWRDSLAWDFDTALFCILVVAAILARWPWRHAVARQISPYLHWSVTAFVLVWIASMFDTYSIVREPFPPEAVVRETVGHGGRVVTVSPFRSGVLTMQHAVDVHLRSAQLAVLVLAVQGAASSIRQVATRGDATARAVDA